MRKTCQFINSSYIFSSFYFGIIYRPVFLRTRNYMKGLVNKRFCCIILKRKMSRACKFMMWSEYAMHLVFFFFFLNYMGIISPHFLSECAKFTFISISSQGNPSRPASEKTQGFESSSGLVNQHIPCLPSTARKPTAPRLSRPLINNNKQKHHFSTLFLPFPSLQSLVTSPNSPPWLLEVRHGAPTTRPRHHHDHEN